MPLVMTEKPTQEPVSLAEVKRHSIIEHSSDDVLLTGFIKAATLHGQHLTGRQFVQAGFELDHDAFPPGIIKLAPNLQEVASVTYKDEDGQPVTLDPAEYKVKKTGIVGYIKPVSTWPSTAEDVLISFTAGWPLTDDVEPVPTTPDDIKAWICVRVAGMYEHREPFLLSMGGRFGVSEMPKSFVDHMLDCWTVPGWGAGI